MNKFAKCEDGLSLVELLVVVAIGSIALLLISTIHIFIQNQYNSQLTDVKVLTDITIAMRAITKDIRAAEELETSEDLKQLIILAEGEEIVYFFENHILKKNGTPYIDALEDFSAEYNGTKIELKIVSLTGKTAETEIVLRGG